ncbi:glycoside hydrolase family 76 protein [Bacteroides sp. 519]|uniref:glycoside hydrolase family 76 protein n=1 Tax=Bacteroides sp. 519 TaxID=2302937 RepID=UPI0013D4A23E|nr:glycoside hydrolase family 76 protein [Bacteroides sp. 519]NDV60322.1 hydrolase [Bacteroides sp. 519]
MKTIILCCLLTAISLCGCSDNKSSQPTEQAVRNMMRAIELTDKAIPAYFQENMKMARFYNPYTKTRSEETGSIWMYTSSIETVNAILHGLKALKENGQADLYNQHFERYTQLLEKLHTHAAYYLGTFNLVSFTQTKEWTVYGVNRGAAKGTAKVEGIENVYDDQQWLARELLEAYKLTNNRAYLTEAEYLTEYVLDGWDCVPDENGNEYGGIPWGPGYVTKHSCSNGPMVSPLVWLHELYKDKNDEITYRYIDTDKSRKTTTVKKSDYYLEFAKKIYNWQKTHLLLPNGVYDDMMGGCDPDCTITYEEINGVTYKKHIDLRNSVGPPITYNSGTMLSGAADLYRVIGENKYLEDAQQLTEASFSYFAKPGKTVPGYYTYDISGFRNWFNGVLMRGYVDVYPAYKNASVCIESFQKNLDYGYDNYLYEGLLPTDLLGGWNEDNSKNSVEGMFTFAFAAGYAVLARYEMEKLIINSTTK